MISFVREKFVAGRSAANAPAAVAAVDLRDDSWTDGRTDGQTDRRTDGRPILLCITDVKNVQIKI